MRACTATVFTSCSDVSSTSCECIMSTRVGEPDAGNLHVRFDEGERKSPLPTRPSRTLFEWTYHMLRSRPAMFTRAVVCAGDSAWS
jgi:hypothetical protein